MVLTREYLAQYVYLESCIKSMERRLKYFEKHPLTSEHGVVSGSRKEFPYIGCHFVISGANVKSGEERKKIVNQLKIDLDGNLQLFRDMQLDIEEYINTLENIEDKTIMRLKYIDRYTDEEIGNELGFERSWIGRKIDKIISKSEEAQKTHS